MSLIEELENVNLGFDVKYVKNGKSDVKSTILENKDVKSRKNTDQKHPIEKANAFSRLFCGWTLPILVKGYKNPLVPSDIPPLPKSLSSGALCERFESYWKKYESGPSRPIHLLKVLVLMFSRKLIISNLLIACEELIARICQPIFIGLFLSYLSNKSEHSDSKGILYTIGICLFSLMSPLLHHPNFLYMMCYCMSLKMALSAFIFRKALKLSQKSVGKVSVGKVVNYLSNDMRKFDEVVLFLPYIWVAPVQLLIVGWILWRTIGYSSLFGLLMLVMYIPMQSSMSRVYVKLRMSINAVTDERSCIMNEIIQGIKVIKMYTWEEPFAKAVSQIRKQEFYLLLKMSLFRAINNGLFTISTKLIMIITLSAAVHQGIDIITPEQMFLSLSMFYTIRLTVTLFFQFGISTASEAWSTIKRFHAFLILEELPAELMETHMDHVPVTDPIVQYKEVYISWQEDQAPILKNISFEVTAGELLIIIGEIGSGKSSLLMSIISELKQQKGSIIIDGRIAYVPQEPWIFSGTIKENILFDLPYEKKKYESVIKACSLSKDLKQLPFGDQSLVGERGLLLSGGQKARIGLARALYFDADIYVMDDPLSAVDAKISQLIFERCIQLYLKNKVKILVTHQLQYVKHATNILILEDGEPLFMGSYDDLLEKNLDVNKYLHKDSDDDPANEMAVRSKSVGSFKDVDAYRSGSDDKVEEADESRAIGSVQWLVYFKFMMAGGGVPMIILLVFFNIAAYSLSITSDWWLSVWVDAKDKTSKLMGKSPENATLVEQKIGTLSHYEMYLVLTALSIFFLMFCTIINFSLCVISGKNLHNKMFYHLLHSPMSFFNTNPTGRILNRFTKDIGQIDDLIPRIFNDVIGLSLLSTSIVVMVSILNYVMIFPTLFLLILFVAFRHFCLNSLRDLKRLEGTSKSPVFSHVNASFNGLASIRSYGKCEESFEKFESLQDENSAIWLMYLGAIRFFGISLDMLTVLFICATTTFCYTMSDTIPAGQIGFILSQSVLMCGLFQWVVRQSTELESNMISVERVLEYGDLTPESPQETAPDKRPPVNWPYSGKIQLQDLSLSYNEKDPPVLKNISCEIAGSEKIGIVGRTGAGKSSLITSLFRLTNPDGVVKIDNVIINDLGLYDVRKKISIIPQDPLLFTNTARYNLDPFNEYKDEHIWNVLEQVYLKDYMTALPSGLSTMLTEGGSNFSVGQRQLICLARCMLKQNKILILDEATANIDANTDAMIQKTIRKEFKECTVLTIAHRLDTVIDSDRIMVLDDGNLIEFDSPYNLLKDENSTFYSLVKESNLNIQEFIN